jgi:GNAT superfamily N-acetyltransferase
MKTAVFQDSDLADVQHLHHATFSSLSLTSFLWQPCQQVESLTKSCIKLVVKERQMLGYAAAYRLDETHFRLNLLVDPQATRRGIGTLLLRDIEAEVRQQGGKYLQARLLEQMQGSIAFALAHDFVEIHRMRGMSLDSDDFSYEHWQPLVSTLAPQGFVSTTYQAEAEAQRQPLDRLVALHLEAKAGWHSPDPTWPDANTPEEIRLLFQHIPKPEHFSIMCWHNTYVAYTSAERTNMTGTAVHPAYRGKGIATALKAYDLHRCIVDGQNYFETSSANPAMLKVNERLGYRLNGLCEVRLLKYL